MATKGGKRVKKGANGYKLPDPIAAGEIVADISKKQWIIGKSIGVGGFGEIYSAAPYSGKNAKDFPHVIKIEPHGNGPLFVEMHFYMRNAKADDISAWKKKKKLTNLGMPQYIGSGSHEYRGTRYRFVVMERYGVDLWKLFLENNRHFPEHTVYKLAIQIIDVLEYMHSKTYVHADIKGANLLLDLKTGNQVYLVDFGLASHYTTKSDYKLDPKKAHNGTIEYTSRDAHMGVPTMRGDIEILGYNIVQWLCGHLPWENNLKDPSVVQKQKEKAMNNVAQFLKDCFGNQVPVPLTHFFSLLAEIKFNEAPNYAKFRQFFEKGLQKLGHTLSGKLDFIATKKAPEPDVATPKKKPAATGRRKSPRTKVARSPSPVGSALDESTVGIVIDKKREKLRNMKKILETISDDSETEYDIQIVKKKKKKVEDPILPKAVAKKPPLRRGRKIVVESDDSETEIVPKGTRTRNVTTRRAALRHAPVDSDDDMFDE